ncbi:MAG: hypothetical protein IH628_06165 [Proteobacteria bacterium]|nr:hypothetical protein [Pseudomonadota bacterium]
MYVDHAARLIQQCTGKLQELRQLREFKTNLESGLDLCLEIAERQPYRDENLASIPPVVEKQRVRLRELFRDFEAALLPCALEAGAA